ncbi:MAG: twin-arginine translocation (Tat) [Bradyrhizobium sp.]|uniref:twin-arginine translocation (Tat) n=1 Tax=Bradyrhizobium sp. TaxID=376 RepID=UPI001208E071|nr:twin-arginine translocation (Tat) [Bradyrhizobium sp.]THD56642.1 MAG: twin-arginine translocation (Tat) [Bradyrhizobium sp.]
MERRHFLRLTVGFVAGAAALAASAQAAPLPPIVAGQPPVPSRDEAVEPAVISQDEVNHLKPEPIRWGHHWHHRHRHWGWRRHHWHRRHWGWHRHHWHRHRW